MEHRTTRIPRNLTFSVFVLFCIALTLGCGEKSRESKADATNAPAINSASGANQEIDNIAEQFVKLALAIGQHDKAFVDAYHGPEEWQEKAKQEKKSLIQLSLDAKGLINAIDGMDEPDSARSKILKRQLVAAATRIEMAQNTFYPFNEETRLLYDAVAPEYDTAHFDAVIEQIGTLLPGEGSIAQRVDAFRDSLAIPEDKLQAVFDAAIKECRARTLAHYDLPEGESFRLEFVKDKPWSGYNWYQGDYESLIQVNTDFPIIIDRAIDLGCHEGYPGHHTWNVLLERDVLKKNGWIEYSVYPLFSPLSITAEGSANYGIELAFPDAEKSMFERNVLFPIAGLDPAKAETLAQVNKLRAKLSHARNHIARAYLDEKISREEAIFMSMKYNLMSRARAEQSLAFIETYRGYVINYNLGRDLIGDFIDHSVANGEDRWSAFEHILRTPTSASDIKQKISQTSKN